MIINLFIFYSGEGGGIGVVAAHHQDAEVDELSRSHLQALQDLDEGGREGGREGGCE